MAKVESTEVEIHIAPGRLWKAYTDLRNILPKLVPDMIRSVDWIQGDGNAGSIREVKFGPAVKGVTFAKEVIDFVDNEKHTVSYHILDGELIKWYSYYKVTAQIVPTDSGISLFKYLIEYEPLGEAQAPEEFAPKQHKQGFAGFLKLLEAHLVANEAEYV